MGTEALTGTEGTSSRCWWHQSLFFHFTSELTVADRRQKREIRQLEQELHKWQVLVDSITGEASRGQCSLAPLSHGARPVPGWLAGC